MNALPLVVLGVAIGYVLGLCKKRPLSDDEFTMTFDDSE